MLLLLQRLVLLAVSAILCPGQAEAFSSPLAVERMVTEKLERITSGYITHIDAMTRILDFEVELSIKTEKCLLKRDSINGKDSQHLLLSKKYQRKQSIMKECLNANYQTVHRLLIGVGDTRSLLQTITFAPISMKEEGDDSLMLGNGGVADKDRETEGYDTAKQVIHHTARDWTLGASPCRELTNGWIVNALVENTLATIKTRTEDRTSALRVLVPGAGLGRVAYDIATCGSLMEEAGINVHVEANDSSVTMALATKSVLEIIQQQPVQQYQIYPFVSDPQRNEIDSAKRFEMELFPDFDAFESYQTYNDVCKGENNDAETALLPNLSYTVGDFVSTYSRNAKQGKYDVIATSFFLDTATNIYQYIMIMKHLLQSSEVSLWINCGPVQWHPCALLRPTVDELRDMLEASGFELITWEISEKIVAYRHPDDSGVGEGLEARYTRSEGYRPLRFVARLAGDPPTNIEDNSDLPLRIEYCEYLNGVANSGSK